jgi:regulator of replication initiation timing
VGAIAIALIAALGNIAIKVYEKWAARDFTQHEKKAEANAEMEKAHESRPWAEMGRRLDDLKEENDKLHAENDRLRDERDHARLRATDWQIEARKAAGALARVTELQQQCEQERIAHQQIVERLSAEIRRLRGDH